MAAGLIEDPNAVDEPAELSTIGILLAADRDDVAVQYALRGLQTPLAISTYTTYRALPDEVRPAAQRRGARRSCPRCPHRLGTPRSRVSVTRTNIAATSTAVILVDFRARPFQ